MKTKTWPDDAGVPEIDDWLRMNDWLAELRHEGQAELREEGPAEPSEDDRAEPASHGDPRPEAVAAAPVNGPTARAETTAHTVVTMRAVIGDQLRMPTAWCEMGSCIARHTHAAALGEADIRARAIAAGWCVDALGRLACPRCQQTAAGFRSPRPVALWDRDVAITMAARMTATAAEISHDFRRPVIDHDLASRAEPELHHQSPAASAMPASPSEPGRHRQRPAAKTTPTPLEPGRHRERPAAKTTPASQQTH